MAQQWAEAWLTSATNDADVIPALVLAESLKRTKTTKRIGVITSENVSKDNRVALRKAFDAFFLMDESFVANIAKEEQAKIYAFSLRLFDKCVFLSPNSLVLENADKLFKGKKAFKIQKNDRNGFSDLSIFLFSPCLELCEYLATNITQNGKILSGKYLKSWIAKDHGRKAMGYISDNSVLKFSLKTGSLLKQMTHADIIQFVDAFKSDDLINEITFLQTSEMGLSEKLILEKWLEIYHQTVANGLLKNPKVTPSYSSNTNGRIYHNNEPIAIIGMSCRYPGANTVEEFWNLLYQGEEGVCEPPAFRWTKEHSLRVSQQERKTNAGFLSSTVDEFDARFFGVSPKEAAYMDPQARLLHEIMWESLEDSGIDPLGLYGTHTGIFTGSWMNDYKDIIQGSTEKDFFRTYMGNSIGAAAARLSFLLGLTGPSIATESGCSSAIVALDLAVKSLRSGESTLALAGGVNLLLHPFTSNIMDYVIAPNGRCKTFDSKADGFGRAEGCGVLVLKRLSDALRDRDNIWAMIRGSAVSQEGLSRSLGTPTVHCEALAMQLALEDANVDPSQVSFVETHGTGTAVGDPMEIAAIAKAYKSEERTSPLVIGSVKTNVGHTESCSGITGIMKTILAMQHELIPKHRNLETLNPEIQLDMIPAKIPLEPIVWPKVKGVPRIAGVSSFGITGTDGHVIIQEAPDYELPKFTLGLERPLHIMKISGKTEEALEGLLKSYENMFNERTGEPCQSFANAAYTANIGRASFNHRAFIVASNYEDAIKAIQGGKCERGEVKDSTEPGKICFLFTGQGCQYNGMAKTLYETSPVFRIHFDECDRILRKLYNISIVKVLWTSDPSSKELSRTIYSQTSIFCVEYCLLKLWQSWGINPDYVLGHSLGEFAAAVAAGILNFQDALKLVAERSRLIDNLPRGSMLVIKAHAQEVNKYMKAADIDLDFAAVNNPDQTVVAGDTSKIQNFLDYLKENGLKAIILEATHAFHSRHMDPMLDQYRKVAETIAYNSEGAGNKCKFVSGMEGRILDNVSQQMNADYWVRHTREKVSFIDACKSLREEQCQEFLEVGPQPILSSFVMMNNEDSTTPICLPSLRRGTDEWQTILSTLGKLYLLNYKVHWKAFDDCYTRSKVSLPFHPFHRKSFWVECNTTRADIIHPLVGHSMSNASNLNIFQHDLRVKSIPYVRDHCIGNRMVFPGAGYAEMCLTAGHCVANSLTAALEKPRRAIRIENLRIDAPLELKEEKSCRMQVVVDLPAEVTGEQQAFRVKVFHQNNSEEGAGKWVMHASANFTPVPSTNDTLTKWKPERIAELMDSSEAIPTDSFYKRVDETGLKFGEAFRGLTRHWSQRVGTRKEDEVVAELKVPQDYNKYLLHPLIIDAMFQVTILTKYNYQEHAPLRVPVHISELTLFPEGNAGGGTSMSTFENLDDNNATDNVVYLHSWWENEKSYTFLVNKDLLPIAYLGDGELIDTTTKTIESILEQQTSCIPDAWEEIWKVIPGSVTGAIKLPEVPLLFTTDEFQERVKAASKCEPSDVDIIEQINRLIYLYILNALYDLGWNPQMDDDSMSVLDFCCRLGILPSYTHLVHFYLTVLQDEDGSMEYDNIKNTWKVNLLPPPPQNIKLEMQPLADKLKTTKASVVVNIYENLSKNLSQILTGNTSALSILFPTEENQLQFSADSYYQNHPGRADGQSKVVETVSTLLEKARSINEMDKGIYKVLEVGAGTGSMSEHSLRLLRTIWGDQFEYHYTDISQGFFGKADKKLETHRGNLKFAVFNIEDSPLDQGIPLNYFDLVLCTDVIHATKNIQESLTHLRQTMRPGGALIFTETMIAARDITFIFGLLSGYWRMEDLDLRPHHCCVGEQTWRHALAKSGFQSVQVTPAYINVFGCITAEASNETRFIPDIPNRNPNLLESNQKTWIVFTQENNTALQLAVNILASCGSKVVSVFMRDTGEGKIVSTQQGNISAVTVESDFENSLEIKNLLTNNSHIHGVIYGWGMNMLERDQKKLTLPFLSIAQCLLTMKKPPKFYILTQSVHAINDSLVSNPSASTLFGMAKSLKNENSELFVRYVDLEQECCDVDTMTNQILYELAMNLSSEFNRVQVAYRDNIRYEPRFTKSKGAKSSNNDQLSLPQSSDRYHLVLPKSRMITDLEFEPLEHQPILENEVEVAIKCFALNFKDLLTILKPSAEFEQLHTVGLDFAGVVTKIGPNMSADNKLQIGDRVFGANFKEAQLPSHLVLDANGLLKIPAGMTYWEAATLPAVFATSLHCLVNIAKMKAGETVLIHTGSGGVGLAAIQLAKHIGANIITTAGNARKRAYLESLGVEHVFHSRNPSFGDDIMRVTNGKGVDIVLNSITGPGLKEASLRVCSKNARFVEMSKLAIWSEDEVKSMRPDVSYSIVDLTVLERDVWANLLDNMREHLIQGSMKAIPFVKFDALYIRQAFQYFQKAKHIGKVVCVMPEVVNESGKFTVNVPLFNGDSTYLVTGGLGGIGFEVCKWMLEKGATDIVLMGRSPPKKETDAQIQQLNGKGFNVVVKLGDVGNYNHCKDIIEDITKNMKPLRGIQHSAGVLRDNMFNQQSWSSLNATFTPKVNGTWNLHTLTRDMQLEHFVFYSSITALMGTPGQPNHSAANCFEDAFAHYRHSLGLRATSVNWGQWAQVGCAKEITLTGILPVSVKRMLYGLEIALRTQKVQSCFGDFESLAAWSLLCPMMKSYLDERILNKLSDSAQSSEGMKADQFWQEMDDVEEKQEKMKVLSIYLKRILRSGLRLDADEAINDDANIQDLGVDSLMMIELKNSIQTLFGSRLTVTAALLKNCTSVRDIAAALVGALTNDVNNNTEAPPLSTEDLIALLEADCKLDETIQLPQKDEKALQASALKTLFVTGCTGQLAPYILSELCKSYKLDKIVCLIRANDRITPEKKLANILKSMNLAHDVDLSQIECVRGDVEKLHFGMEADKYQELSKSVDGVIHCAVKSNHIEPYRNCESGDKGGDVRNVNVGGTINVLKFAATSRVKHVYYASAFTSIFGGNEEDTLCDDWPEMDQIKAIADNNIPGYQISKYVCEMLMKEANARGIPCKVFRFPWITGDSKTGQLNYINNHYILRLLSYLKLKAVPSLVMPAVVLPVDTCAELSLKLFLNDNVPFEAFNIGHPDPQVEQEFVNAAMEEFGLELQIVELQEFVDKLQDDSPLEELKELYTNMERNMGIYTSDAFRSLRGYINSPEHFFKNKKVEKYIPNFAANIDTSMNIIRKNLKYVKSTGFFEKFNI